jgi:hypothetical protein
MDTAREINAIKNLIPSATGENLIYLNQRLAILLKKKEDEERARQPSKVREVLWGWRTNIVTQEIWRT